jgi:hypothetical protein
MPRAPVVVDRTSFVTRHLAGLFRSGEDGAAPTYDEVVEEALCFGWIDSTVRRRDDRTNAMLLTPRRPAQPRRGRTRRRVERLTPPGS